MTGPTEDPAAAAQADPAASRNPLPVMFLHIPKTAGTSFIGTLRNTFGQDRLIRLVHIDEQTSAEVGRLLSERPGDLACLVGHIPYHAIAPWRDRCRIFTILRHPIARVMSLYRFLQGAPPAERERLGLRPEFSFNEFIASRHPELFAQIHDGMVRMLSGDAALGRPDSAVFWNEAVSLPATEAALLALDGMDFGLAEDMDGTLRIARAAWGISHPLGVGRDNVTRSMTSVPELECGLEITARNPMDLVFYSRARDLFAARCAALESGPDAASGPAGVFCPAPGEEVAIGSIPGLQGFHEAESSGFAWLDSQQPGRIHFGQMASAVRFRLYCYAIDDTYPIGEIELQVNGTPLAAHAARLEGRWFRLATEPVSLHRQVNVLSIRPPYFVPVRHLDPATGDRRSLAIALAKVAFLSA